MTKRLKSSDAVETIALRFPERLKLNLYLTLWNIFPKDVVKVKDTLNKDA